VRLHDLLPRCVADILHCPRVPVKVPLSRREIASKVPSPSGRG
jgi:hypothetical protein